MNENSIEEEENLLPFTTNYPPISTTISTETPEVVKMSWKPFKNGITSLTVDIPQSKPSSRKQLINSNSTTTARTRELNLPSISKWRTKEFCLYYAVFVIAVPYMIKSAVDLSKG